MPITRSSVVIAFVASTTLVLLNGCSSGEKKKPDFFTSGNREADQRAEQRMAKDEQLKDAKSAGSSEKADAKKSLYDRLGGEKGITAIVDDFVPRAMSDPRVNWDRKGVKRGGFSIHRGRTVTWNPTPEAVQQLKKHLVQFFSLSSGGPAVYEGREMKEAHAGLHITNAEFDASVGDLKASMDKLQVPLKEQKELLALIESTRPQVAEER
ncbi:MAG: globin-like protein [Phycisphaerales bacterium]|nr:globin-like protein [Phycisphaerales bacterium]